MLFMVYRVYEGFTGVLQGVDRGFRVNMLLLLGFMGFLGFTVCKGFERVYMLLLWSFGFTWPLNPEL